ncbi:MAG: Zn-dependent hydrolase, partial [Pygmaiobacter sp.]
MNTKVERIQKDIEELSVFNSTPGNGLTRLSFTPEHKGAETYISGAMKAAGLTVRRDAVGTLIGRLEGEDPEAAPVMAGSHYDSVKNGGNFDGPAGVVMGLETARVYQDLGKKPKRPVEFVAMIEEEGTRFSGGLFASRAMAGRLTAEELVTFHDQDGITTSEAMKAFGLEPAKLSEAVKKPGEIKNFIELHIEQGPILEGGNLDVGIVKTIVGIKELQITVTGRPDHAGTTPMNMRADAFLAASKIALAANEAAVAAGNGTVATVGKVNVLPGAFNIVPGKVELCVDIRSPYTECLDKVFA